MSGRARRRIVASPNLVAYWSNGDLVLFNYATGRRLIGTSSAAAIVHACTSPRTVDEIAACFPVLPRETVAALVALMLRRQILYDADRPLPADEQRMLGYSGWNPAAGFFHAATRDVKFGIPSDPREASEFSGGPSPSAQHSGGERHSLPAGEVDGEFPSVLLERRTWRRFGKRPISRAQMALLLRLTGGVHHWVRLANGRKMRLRTSPSGGARHPIDLFVVCRRVTGLRSGIYRYDSERHELSRIGGWRSADFDRYLPAQPWYLDAAVLVFFVATFERTRRRYSYSRAYRAVLIEAGHLCQTFCLTATWLGLAPFCSIALADAAIEKDLGVDGVSEAVLYAAGAGTRPGGEKRGTVPFGVSIPRIVENPAFRRRLRR